VGQEGSTISSSKNPGFSSGGTNYAEHLILTSSIKFQSAVVPGGRNSNPPPSAIPARWIQKIVSSFSKRQSRYFYIGFMLLSPFCYLTQKSLYHLGVAELLVNLVLNTL
jgi:hypothetical protein